MANNDAGQVTREIDAVLHAYASVLAGGGAAVLATVVRARGSTSRGPGARMLIGVDGWLAGAVSSGSLEADLLRTAFSATCAGPALVTYDCGSAEGGVRLGCTGAIDVLLTRVGAGVASSLDAIADHLGRGLPVTVASVLQPASVLGLYVCEPSSTGERDGPVEASLRVLARSSRELDRPIVTAIRASGSLVEAYVETLRPPRSLLVFGEGCDVAPLAVLGSSMGWRVTVVLTGPGGLQGPSRLPDTTSVVRASPADVARLVPYAPDAACVVMTHDLERDRATARSLLLSNAEYIGLLGPRRRTDALRDDILADRPELAERWLRAVHAPIGLQLGATEPEEIALAIVAEIQATHAQNMLERAIP